MAGRVRVYFEGESKGVETAAKRTEKAIDGVDGKTRSYTKSVDEQSRSTDRASGSLDRHAKSARSSSTDNDRLSKSLRDVNTRVTAMRNAIQLIKWPALATGAGYAAEGLGELGAAAVGLTSALAPLSGLLIAYPAYLGALAQGLGVGKLALFGVTDAVKEMSGAQETAGTTATESGKAQKSAAEGVRSAQETLNSSVRSAKDARLSLNQAEEEAVTNLRNLADAAVDASLGEQRAALDLQNAKKALRQAQNEPGKHDFAELEDLELSVKEAQQGLREAKEEKRDAEQARDKGDRRGVKHDPKVLEAKRALVEANHQIVVSARALHAAEEAESESMKATGTAASNLQQKLASMPVAGQKFAKFLFGLDPKLKTLQATAASGLLPGVEGGIKKALNLFPRLNSAVDGTSKVMGGAAEKIGTFLGSKGFGRDFTLIAKGNETLIARLGASSVKWADALRQVLVAGQPLLDWISKSGLEFATWADNSAKAGRETGSLAGFFDKTRTVAEKLIHIVGNLGGAFLNIGHAAAPLGEDILHAFERSSESFEKWTDSMKGQNELKAYFAEAKPGIFEMGRLVRDAGDDLANLSKGKGFYSMTHAVRTELLPVLTEMVGKTTEAFGPALVEALVQVGKLFGNLSGASGPLTLFVGQVTSMLKAINWGFKNIPGLKTFVVTMAGIATVAKALKFTGMVTGLSSSLGLVKKLLIQLGLVAAEEKTIGEMKIGEFVAGGGVPIGVGGVGRKATTVAEDVGEFGEKKAVNEALGIGKTTVEAGAGMTIGQRALSALPRVLGTGAGLGATGVLSVGGALLYNPGGGLLNPNQAGWSDSEEKAHLNRAERRYERNLLKDAGVNLDTVSTKKQLATLKEQFGKTMAGLKSDAILGMGAINGALGTGLDQVNGIWQRGTKPWRAHTAQAMRDAVAEIRQGMKAGSIGTEEGQREINGLLAKIHLVRGSDPFGLADATTKQFKEANAITASGVADWTRKLELMPKAAREKSRLATNGMLEEWAAGHPKIEAQIENLADFEIRKFGATNKQIREGVKQGATGPVAEAFKEAAHGVGDALENIKVNANQMLEALGWDTLVKFKTQGFGVSAKLTGEAAKTAHNHGRARGGWGEPGFLSGTGKRDSVHVMAAPGEAFLTQHQQPEVEVGLALAKAFGIGQSGSLGELFANRTTPHYVPMAKGGEVSGPRATATIAGAALNKVDKAVSKFLARHPDKTKPAIGSEVGYVSGGGGSVVAQMGRILMGAGYNRIGAAGIIGNALQESGWNPSSVGSGGGGLLGFTTSPISLADLQAFARAQNKPWDDVGVQMQFYLAHEYGIRPRMNSQKTPGAAAAYFMNEWEHPYEPTQNQARREAGARIAYQRGYERGGAVPHFARGGTVGTAARAVAWATNNVGTQQGSKKQVRWANETGGILDPWCAEFVSADMAAMGLPLPSNPAYSGSFSEGWEGGEVVGSSLGAARLGDLLNFENEHIGIYVGGGRMVSGNWSDEVAEALVSEDSHGLSAVIRPFYGDAGPRSSRSRAGGGRRSGGGVGGRRAKPEKPGIGPAVNTGSTTRIDPAVVAAVAPLAAGTVTGAATSLPKQFQAALRQPGLSFAQKLAVANEALTYGEENETSIASAADFGIELEQGNKKRLQKQLTAINKELKTSTTPKKRENLLGRRDEVLSNLGIVKTELGNFRSAKKAEREREPTPEQWANAELAEAELTPGDADDKAVQHRMLSLAEQRLQQAKNDKNPEEIAAAAAEVKQLRETLETTNTLAAEQLHASAQLAEAELTPGVADDEAAQRTLLSLAEQKLHKAEEEGNDEEIASAAGEVKQLREALNPLTKQAEAAGASLALAELTPDQADDAAARKELLQIAEVKLQRAKEAGNNQEIASAAQEVKGLREAVEASNELQQQRESFEKERLETDKRLAKLAEQQGPAVLSAMAGWFDGAIGGPLQTRSRLATAGQSAAYN